MGLFLQTQSPHGAHLTNTLNSLPDCKASWSTHISIAFDDATKSHLSQSRSSPCMCFTCHSCDFSERKHRSHCTHLMSVYGTRSCARHMWFENSANVLNVMSQPARVHLNMPTTEILLLSFCLLQYLRTQKLVPAKMGSQMVRATREINDKLVGECLCQQPSMPEGWTCQNSMPLLTIPCKA